MFPSASESQPLNVRKSDSNGLSKNLHGNSVNLNIVANKLAELNLISNRRDSDTNSSSSDSESDSSISYASDSSYIDTQKSESGMNQIQTQNLNMVRPSDNHLNTLRLSTYNYNDPNHTHNRISNVNMNRHYDELMRNVFAELGSDNIIQIRQNKNGDFEQGIVTLAKANNANSDLGLNNKIRFNQGKTDNIHNLQNLGHKA